MRGLTRFTWMTIAWNVVVIVLGALVRATGSGAGCGRSWPTCQGEFVPALEGATRIEFTHRAVSGIALVLVAILVWRVYRATDAGHPARRGAFWSGIAILGEAAIGAVIVLFEWVADDASVARSISVPVHLVNTLLLLAALTLTAFWLHGGSRLAPSRHPRLRRGILWIGGGLAAIAATGSVTALADTLFPKEQIGFGASDEEHFLTALRVVHPIVAIGVGVAAVLWIRWTLSDEQRAWTAPRIVVGAVWLQFVLGFANVLLLTPTWLSLVHLAIADVVWIAWVWLGARLLQPAGVPAVPRNAPARPDVDPVS